MSDTPRTDLELANWDESPELKAVIQLSRQLERELNAASERINLLERACAKQNEEICQTAGKALGYPWFKDDQKNFTGATEADGVCVGEHVAETIVAELAKKHAEANERIKRLESIFSYAVNGASDAFDESGIKPGEFVDRAKFAKERIKRLEGVADRINLLLCCEFGYCDTEEWNTSSIAQRCKMVEEASGELDKLMGRAKL